MKLALSPADIFTQEWFTRFLTGTLERYGLDRVLNPEEPLESPIEYELERVLCKYIPEGARMIRQLRVPTYRGTFRVDMVVRHVNSIVGFEADGKEYHDWTRDIFRDAIILKKSNIKRIYRITGPDVYYRLETALFMIGKAVPGLFSERGMADLWCLSECRDDLHFETDTEGIYGNYVYVDEEGEEHYRRIHVRCLSPKHENFHDMLEFAYQHRSVKLDKLWNLSIAQRLISSRIIRDENLLVDVDVPDYALRKAP